MLSAKLESVAINANPVAAAWEGFDLYCKGAQLEDMPSADHKRGWWFARECQGDTLDLEDNIADRMFWARGAW